MILKELKWPRSTL